MTEEAELMKQQSSHVDTDLAKGNTRTAVLLLDSIDAT